MDPLYQRSLATALASWEEDARGSDDADVVRTAGVAAAIFPTEPERGVFNNAILDRDLDAKARSAAIAAMERAYEAAEVDRFAAWVHESDQAMAADLRERGYTLSETTRAMGLALDGELPADEAKGEIGELGWSGYLSYLETVGLPPGLMADVDPHAYAVLAATVDGEVVATAIAYDHDGDCGIFNMSTLEHMRRRGLGTGLAAAHLRAARARGCTTATLQSTPIAEPVYTAVGFRDLGRILEFAQADPT